MHNHSSRRTVPNDQSSDNAGGCGGIYHWVTMLVTSLAIVTFSASVAVVGPLEGVLGDGIEFALCAIFLGYLSIKFSRIPAMKRKVLPKKQ